MIDMTSVSTWVYLSLMGIGLFLLIFKLKITLFPDSKAKIVSFPDMSADSCRTCKSTDQGRMSIPITVETTKGKRMEAEASVCELCLNKLTVGSVVGVSRVGSRYVVQSGFGEKGFRSPAAKKNPKRLIGLFFVIGLLLTCVLIAAFTDAESIQAGEIDLTDTQVPNEDEDDHSLRTTNDLVNIIIPVTNPYGEGNVTISLYHEQVHDSTTGYEDEGVNDFVTKLTPFKASTIFDATSTMIGSETITMDANSSQNVTFAWDISDSDEGAHFFYVIITPDNSTFDEPMEVEGQNYYVGVVVYGAFNEDTDVLKQITSVKFIIGLVALILFFAIIMLSLLGVIPQDRLPVQAALIITAFVIVVMAFIGNMIDEDVLLISALDLEGMVIIHPITALVAGFLVAGSLEAAGAFEAAADALNKMEGLKIGNWEVLGIAGTVAILVNVPTIISMPCGRILGAALMPAALYFGYKIARNTGDLRIVGVVVFGFIVNAAASCGPSPLGGIGTIGEGLSRMNIGTFSDAQQIGIMMATGVCMVVLRFVTPLIPADLKEEVEEKEEAQKEAKKKDEPGFEVKGRKPEKPNKTGGKK